MCLRKGEYKPGEKAGLNKSQEVRGYPIRHAGVRELTGRKDCQDVPLQKVPKCLAMEVVPGSRQQMDSFRE